MSVAGRLLTALGLSFVTVTGLEAIQNYFLNTIIQHIGGFPDDALNILYIAGFGVMLNWIFGTFTFIASLKTFTKLSASLQRK